MFGLNTTSANSGFGQPAGFNATSSFTFGASNNNAAVNNATGNSTFGMALGAGPATGGFGSFGAQTGTPSGFGSTTFGQTPASQAFAFATPSTQAASGPLFSANTANPSTGGMFGNTLGQPSTSTTAAAPKPFNFGGAVQTGTLGGGGGGFGGFSNLATTSVTTSKPTTTASFGLGSGMLGNATSGFASGQAGVGATNAAPMANKFFAPSSSIANSGGLGSSALNFSTPASSQLTGGTTFQLGGMTKPADNATPFGGGFSATGFSTPVQSSGMTFGQISSGTPVIAATSGQAFGGGLSGFGSSLNLPTGGASTSSGFAGFNMSGTGVAGVQPTLGGLKTATTNATTSSLGGFGLNTSVAVTSTPMLTGLLSQPSSNFAIKLPTTPAMATTTTSATPSFNLASGFSLSGTSAATPGLGSTTFGPSTGLTSVVSTSTIATATTTAAMPTLSSKGFGSSFSGGLSLVPASSTTVPTALTTLTTTTTAATALTTAPTTAATPCVCATTTFGQLEDMINRWSQELHEQERIFIQQATQVNAWDRVLLDNGQKISMLNMDMEKVKLDHQRLEQDLNFLMSQQNELEEALLPLEQSVLQQQQPSQQMMQSAGFIQHADVEREHTYKMTENIDAELKRMSNNLKEIIDRINSSSTVSPDNVMYQISKILNAHMDSLQWIDRNADDLQRTVNSLSSQMDDQKRSHSTLGFNPHYRSSPFK